MRGTFNIKPYFDKYVVYGIGETSWNPNAMLVLNEVGYTIFTLLEKGTSLEGIVSYITGEYDVSESTAIKDTKEFIEILKKKHIY